MLQSDTLQTPPVPRVNTRARILEAALDLLSGGRLRADDRRVIRERSGVSNGALFHHFPTKEAIADALYVESIASFQKELWRLLARRPRSLRAAVHEVIAHQIEWIEANVDRARFVYARGTLEGGSPGSAELGEMNRRLAESYQSWLQPLIERGLVRPMSMLVLNAIVTGPTHAIARRWLAGQIDSALLRAAGRAGRCRLRRALGQARDDTARIATGRASRARSTRARVRGRRGNRAAARPPPRYSRRARRPRSGEGRDDAGGRRPVRWRGRMITRWRSSGQDRHAHSLETAGSRSASSRLAPAAILNLVQAGRAGESATEALHDEISGEHDVVCLGRVGRQLTIWPRCLVARWANPTRSASSCRASR